MFALTVFALLWLLRVFVYKPFKSPLKEVSCPPGGTGSQGHIAEILDLQGTKVHDWIKAYGTTFIVRGPFGVHHRIFSIDPRALNHVLKHTNIYTKSDLLRDLVRRYMEGGLIVGEASRYPSQSFREVDVYSTASRCIFDLVGSVGVDHQFGSLGNWEGSGGKLFQKYERMQLLCPGAMGFRMLLSLTWPLIDKIWPSENIKRVNDAMGSLQKFAKEMMTERRLELSIIGSKKGDVPDRKGLLTLMLRHNMAQKINAADSLQDHEISGQLSTFLFAGSETTAGTISFGLYDLTCHPDIQSRLRTEILECGDNLPFDQIDELPYLDAVVKEIMRINPSLPGTVRQAQKDDIIPLAKPVTLTNGKVVTDIHIRKGQLVHVPIEHLHTLEHIWGPAA
ncbi:cytochrome P450 [Cryptococcus deuterogattii LA55]|nr:cytochrome P450 [Cryptococcus deuterogattii LA55]KIR71238.1 cytochrome P450 [Cryptococcus deuterogattii CA1014]KIR94582.1 cytochrome P450 [Cryptococcus deuterogattii CBS 10090]KIS00893.1 cytochrome P450 [Cryptococcus deuterogattii 2001/935-1]